MANAADFPWTDSEISKRVRAAVAEYWKTRAVQAAKTKKKKSVAMQGTRSEVTGGKHLDGLQGIVVDLAVHAGFSRTEILTGAGVELPGFYRPTKKWDVVIVRGAQLCAAIEMKSLVGSFGNNLNNRTEEAIGSSVDIWRAFKEGLLGNHAPFVGYFGLVEDAQGSQTPVGIRQNAFRTDPVFDGASYLRRYEILCERLVQERNYTAATLLLSPRGVRGDYGEPNVALTVRSFMRRFYGHLVAVGL